jgi:integrase
MPRLPKVWWSETGRCWISTAVGPISERNGRRLGLRNREIGPPVGREGAANQARADLWLAAEIAKEAEATRWASDPTLADLMEQYLAWVKPRIEARTLRGYTERLKAFAAYRSKGVCYGDRLARDFRPADLRRVVADLKAKGMASTWTRDVSAAARAVFRWAARPIDDRVPERILSADPFDGVEGVRVEAPPKRYAGQLARREFFDYCLVRVCSIPVKHMDWRWDRLAVAKWRFIEATGCRPDEACRLEWAHIDWQARVATLRGKSTTATGKKRRIPLPPETVRLLRAIEALPDRHDRFVFTHESRSGVGNPTLAGLPWSGDGIKHKFGDWRDAAVAAGLAVEKSGASTLTLYQLRRDLGADILRMTGSYAESAEVLGHSAATNERNYSSFEDGRAVELADKASAARRGGGSSPPPAPIISE